VFCLIGILITLLTITETYLRFYIGKGKIRPISVHEDMCERGGGGGVNSYLQLRRWKGGGR
jgi:hypothetical protein